MAPAYSLKRLDDLPDELILCVLSELHIIRSYQPQSHAFKNYYRECSRQRENDAREAALHAVTLTNSRLRRIGTPILYSSFTSSSTSSGSHRLKLFYQTISRQRDLAAHVEYVENRLEDYRGCRLSMDLECHGGMNMMRRYFSTLASILMCATNLQHLNVVSLEVDADMSLWHDLLRRFSTDEGVEARSLHKLRIIALQLHDEYHMNSPELGLFHRIAERLISIPTVTQLRVSDAKSGRPAGAFSSTFKNLQHLEITNGILNFEEVVHILRACERLKCVSCHWAYLDHDGDSPSDIYPGLLQHASTLEMLNLDMRNVRFGFPIFPLGSLRNFPKLHTVAICEVALLTYELLGEYKTDHIARIGELLPPNLENLQLLSTFSDMVEASIDDSQTIWDFAEDCSTLLPSLRSVVIQTNGSLGRFSTLHLQEAFHQNGVDFALGENSDPELQWEELDKIWCVN